MELDLANKKRFARPYMWSVIGLGSVVALASAWRLPIANLGLPFLLLSAVTVMIGPRAVVRFPRFKSHVSISDTCIFLTMLLFGGEAAILLAAVEAFCSSYRIAKKLTVSFNAATHACSTFVTVCALSITFGPILDLSHNGYSSRLIIAMCVMAIVQYIFNSGMVAVAAALRTNQPIWDTWKQHYLWTSITYFAGASAAGITASLIHLVGFYAVMSMVPIIAIVYFTYLTYLKNVEASVAQAEQAELHIAELEESEERFRSAFDNAPIGMALVSPDGRWLQVNRSLCEILGYSEQELLAMQFQSITHADDLSFFLSKVTQLLEGNILTYQMEKRYIHKLGHEVWALVGISLARDAQSRSLRLIFQIQDITDRKRAEEQLLHEAFHDALTRLPNRALFMDHLKLAIKRAKERPNFLFAVLFLDLDRFKVINDSIGHAVGDQLLVGISHRLQKCLRPEDKVARLGGDEFTILLDDIKDADDAIEVAERIQRQVSQPFNLDGYETSTTASIGIALYNRDYDRPEDLLRDADTAMYQAKSLGKARHAIFDQCMHTRAMSLLQLETDLRRAIERQEFVILYQPIVSLQTNKLIGFEALIRWRHPERELISPTDFIGVAEETGYIVQIGQWVLHEACRQMREWQKQIPSGQNLSISVNLSSKQFAHSNLIDQIMRILKTTGLDPHSLKLEITESVVMENIEAVTGMLEQLRTIGVELSIDDFGTGYSSLSYLHRLPIDTLKIDRSFVSRIDENNENREIVRTIIMLAQNLGMGVVAEGVETKEQLEQLRALKCENGQGYLFSRPVDAEAAGKLIQNTGQWQADVPYLEKPSQKDIFEPLASTYPM